MKPYKKLKKTEKLVACLILAKSKSNRLPGKNTLDFHGKPMFMVNVEKCLKIFDSVYVSSDSLAILHQAEQAGAIPILRGEELCGDTPNIPVYRHALELMPKDIDGIVAVQANSPTINSEIIEMAKFLLENGKDEVMTQHEDGSIYGSIWALSRKRLNEYQDFYNPKPDTKILDMSIDIHNLDDYNKAICQKFS